MTVLKSMLLSVLMATGVPGGLLAQTLVPSVTNADEARIAELGANMQIPRLLAQLRQEGLDGTTSLADQFEIASTGGLQLQMERLYDLAAMKALFLAQLQQGLQSDPETLQLALAFFASPLGQKVVTAEIDARLAVADDAGKAAANAVYQSLAGKDPTRRDLLDGMIAAGDLVEFNVMGALNANLAFLKGLAATGVLGELPESDMVAQVWQDEDTLRQDSAEWLAGFVAIAYRDLTIAELQEYSDFMTSPAGKRLNAVLFAGFDTLYRGLSQQQGRIIGQMMQGDDI